MQDELSNETVNSGKTDPLIKHVYRSVEVDEIISAKPGFWVRWGITILFFLMLFICSLSFFIHYPDQVAVKAKLTSINSPKEIRIKMAGKLLKLNVAEGRTALQGHLLGYVESRANPEEVMLLSRIIDSLRWIMNTNQTELISRYNLQCYQNVGEIQQSYQAFMHDFGLFKQYLSEGYYLKKKYMLQIDQTYLQRLHDNLTQQKEMLLENLGLAKETFDANSKLRDQKVISPLDYRNEKAKYIERTIGISQINSSLITNEDNQHQKVKELLQLENEIAQQKEIFSQALNLFKDQIDEWKTKYLLIAPIDGKVAFAGFFQENQQVQADEIFCYINPENSIYYAEVFIPQYNFGKVRQGAKVFLSLPSYPFQEYGSLEGKLDFISHIATDSGYAAKIRLNSDLRTTFNKQIQYREGLIANGEIITNDMKLSDRFLNQVRSLFKR